MQTPTIPLLRKRILVVEDNSQIRAYISRTLEIEGYTINQAKNGAIALNLLERITPDLILSDVDMPDLDGLGLYHAVRHDRRWVAIPFIFMVSDETASQLLSGQAIEADDRLKKPIDNLLLVRTVNAHLLRASALQIALIDQAYIDTVTVLAKTIEGRDHTTSDHVDRVTTLARKVARALKWPPDQLRILEFGARLHDIGKVIVPDQILNKPGPLDDAEWKIMKSHTVAGAKIIREIKHLQGAEAYALYHHERWDGSGYPHGLKERDIPLEGRLLALVDVYDAMTTNRPYRTAQKKDEVILYLQQHSGILFDPDLIPLFIGVLREND